MKISILNNKKSEKKTTDDERKRNKQTTYDSREDILIHFYFDSRTHMFNVHTWSSSSCVIIVYTVTIQFYLEFRIIYRFFLCVFSVYVISFSRQPSVWKLTISNKKTKIIRNKNWNELLSFFRHFFFRMLMSKLIGLN